MEIILKNTENQTITMSISDKEVVITEIKTIENKETEHYNYRLISIQSDEISIIKYFKDRNVQRNGNKTVMVITLILGFISLVCGLAMMRELTGIILIVFSIIFFIVSYGSRYKESFDGKMYFQLENKSQQVLYKKNINLSIEQVESIKSAIRNVQK